LYSVKRQGRERCRGGKFFRRLLQGADEGRGCGRLIVVKGLEQERFNEEAGAKRAIASLTWGGMAPSFAMREQAACPEARASASARCALFSSIPRDRDICLRENREIEGTMMRDKSAVSISGAEIFGLPMRLNSSFKKPMSNSIWWPQIGSPAMKSINAPATCGQKLERL
jgi:hypothetical protein